MIDMADDDKLYIAKLVQDSAKDTKKEIKDHVDEKFNGLKEQINLIITPIVNEQKHQRTYMEKLEKNADSANTEFLKIAHTFETTNANFNNKITDQGKRFGGRIDVLEDKISNHINRHKEAEKKEAEEEAEEKAEKKDWKKYIIRSILGIIIALMSTIIIYIFVEIIIKGGSNA